MAAFRMPSLGADMEAGTLVEWKIKAGDVVHRGDVVAEVVTEKGDIEIESWLSGTVEKLVVQTGEKVPLKTALAIIRAEEGSKRRPHAIRVGDHIAAEKSITAGGTVRHRRSHGPERSW